jgi:hypothetical protein
MRGLTFYHVQGCGDIRYENKDKKKSAELIVEEGRNERMRRMEIRKVDATSCSFRNGEREGERKREREK